MSKIFSGVALILNVGMGSVVGSIVESVVGLVVRLVVRLVVGSLHWDVLKSRDFLICFFWSESKLSGVALILNVGIFSDVSLS